MSIDSDGKQKANLILEAEYHFIEFFFSKDSKLMVYALKYLDSTDEMSNQYETVFIDVGTGKAVE
jgi:hypothetical protein